MLFVFLGDFINRVTGYSDEPKLSTVHTMCLETDNCLMFKSCGLIVSSISSNNLK